MALNAIRSYLVQLGFTANQPQQLQFINALNSAKVLAQTTISGMASNFISASGLIVGAMATVSGATVTLMERVSQADLGYQLFARRMFMSVDAARKLKVATDALGYSLEEIIWGPPELRERYSQL